MSLIQDAGARTIRWEDIKNHAIQFGVHLCGVIGYLDENEDPMGGMNTSQVYDQWLDNKKKAEKLVKSLEKRKST